MVMILKNRELRRLPKSSSLVRDISRRNKDYFISINQKERSFTRLGEVKKKGFLLQGRKTGKIYAVYGKGMYNIPYINVI